MWKSPTPHEEALAKIDDYMANHVATAAERHGSWVMFGGDKRRYGIRHLRLTAAVNRLRVMTGQPAIDLL